MEMDFSHYFHLRIDFGIFVENLFESWWDVGIRSLVVDWPISFGNGQAVNLLQADWSIYYFWFGTVDLFIVFLGIFYISHDNIACLQCHFTKSELKQLDVPDLLINVVVLGAHQFLSQHILILVDESFLGSIQIDQHSNQIILLIFNPNLSLILLNSQNLPLLSRILIILTIHLLNIFLRRYLHNLFSKFRIVLYIFRQEGDNASEGIVSF